MHSIFLICLDEVDKNPKHKEGGRLHHSKATVPRVTVLAHDKVTARHIFEYANNNLRSQNEPPPGYEFVGVKDNISLVDVVEACNTAHKTVLLMDAKASISCACELFQRVCLSFCATLVEYENRH